MARSAYRCGCCAVHTDIEGAEHAILKEMLAHGTMLLVDVLALECHGTRSKCSELQNEVQKANPKMRVLTERQTGGHDAHSDVPSAEALQRMVSACGQSEN